MPAKKTKRSQTKNPGLVHEVNPKTRWELMDQDYINKLSEKEKEWLSNFNEEYISGNFSHKGKKFHKTKKARRECYSRNNARNRDLYTILRTKGWMNGMENESVLDEVYSANPEEALHEMLDYDDEKKEN
jgi:hypothetical protein